MGNTLLAIDIMIKLKFFDNLLKLSRLKGYLPNLFLIFVFIFIISPQNFFSYETVVIFFANLFLTAFTYAINDVEDAEDDYHDLKKRKRNIISSRTIKKSDGYIISFSFLFAGLTLLFFLNKLVLIIGLILSLNSFLYSWKILRFKSIPILDLISHALSLGAMQIVITYLTFRHLDFQILPFLLFIIPMSFSCQISQQLRDFKVDKKTKIYNSTQLIGEKISIALIYVFCALSVSGFVILYLNSSIIYLSPLVFFISLFYFKKKHRLSSVFSILH